VGSAVLVLCLHSWGEGRIEIDAGGVTAVLQLRSNWFRHTTVESVAGLASVRAGVHRPQQLSISTDERGHTWRINSRGPWADLSRIRVKNLRTTAIRLGPPLLIKPTVRRYGPVVDIDFTIVGQAQERYEKFAFKDNRVVRKARVRIVDEAGHIIEAGSFRYG
jgi:hypothetical protein